MRQTSIKQLTSKRRRKVRFYHELETVNNPTVFSSAFTIGQISDDNIRIAFEHG